VILLFCDLSSCFVCLIVEGQTGHVLNWHGRIQTCLCANASACAPTHADRRRQDILATHGYENTDWLFNMVLCVFMVKKHIVPKTYINYFQEGNYAFNINEL